MNSVGGVEEEHNCTCDKHSVEVCPVSKETWKARAGKFTCRYGSVYHCMSDSQDRKWEMCAEKSLIDEGNCLMTTSDGYFDWKPCNISEPSCPNSSYISDEVYKYPFCFGDNTPRNQTLIERLFHIREGPSLKLILGIVVPVLFIIASAFIFLTYRWRRTIRKKRSSARNWVENYATEPLLPDVNELVAIRRRKTIIDGVSKLSEDGVRCINVIGGIGNLMASTARSILEMYKMKSEWKVVQNEFPKILTDVEENTIMFIYGWFGLWNDNCSLEDAKTVCDTLKTIFERTTNVKIIIGMRKDLYEKYSNDLKDYDFLLANLFFLNDENISDEYSFYLQMIQADCRVPSCTCQKLTIEMLSGGDDKLIGMPLKFEIISRHHDPVLIKSYMEDKKWDILTAMTEHFTALRESERPIYEWIMYICLKGHFLHSEPFDRNLVRRMDFEIKHSSFDEHYLRLSKYIRVSSFETQGTSTDDDVKLQKYVFWHPFIYICAFHTLYKNHKDIVMKHCYLDAILQLVRPPTYDKTEYHLEVSADKTDIAQFRERLQKEGLEEKYKDHPLLEINSS